MPFDTTPKPDVFSLDGLIAWLETQPGETEYNFLSNTDCLLARYLKAHGEPVVSIGGGHWLSNDGEVIPLPSDFRDVAQAWPRTYAGALSQARTLQGA